MIKYLFCIILAIALKRCNAQSTSCKAKTILEYDYINRETMEVMQEGVLHTQSDFNKIGLKIQTVVFNKLGKVEKICKYKYDDNGNCILKQEFNNLNMIVNETKAIIEANGEIVPLLEINATNFCGQKSSDNKCLYDVCGNLVEAIEYNESKEIIFKIKHEIKYW